VSSGRISRRQFMVKSAGAASALAAVRTVRLGRHRPAWAESSERAIGPNDRVRFGMIGVGMQGSGLMATSIRLPGVECAMACDLYDARHALAQEIAGPKVSLPTTRRYQDLLDNKDIDCIVAAVPDHWHRQIVIDAVSAGKDIYCEKPMSHSAADGVEMVRAVEKSGRILQVGSQRVSSVIAAKAKELIAQGTIGELCLVEAVNGRNSPCGAWEYPIPPGISTDNLDWDTWQGSVPKRAFDPAIFARWRCWKEYGTGVAGDLLVHLMSGYLCVMGINEAPKRAMAMGGILRWKDGRNMPDVHAALFDFGGAPVYMRLNLGTETPETYRFMGSKGILEITSEAITVTPQSGEDNEPCYYATSFPKAAHDEYVKEWMADHASMGKSVITGTVKYTGPSWDDVQPHLWNFFQAVRTRQRVIEDVVFGQHAALACHMANESYFLGTAVTWNESAGRIDS
jgi:predicted dehydrogenase